MRVLIESLIEVVADLTLLVSGLALLAFFWGLAKFIFRVGGDENAVEEGKRIMVWGLTALFVMVSIWGLVRWLQKDLDIRCGVMLYGEGDSIPIVCPEVTGSIRSDPEIPNNFQVPLREGAGHGPPAY